MTVNMHEAKTKLSELIRKAEQGEEILIARNGIPAAKISAYHKPEDKRELGFFRGLITVPEDFDEPLPDDILDSFYL
jgi:prevent-host-death family protein